MFEYMHEFTIVIPLNTDLCYVWLESLQYGSVLCMVRKPSIRICVTFVRTCQRAGVRIHDGRREGHDADARDVAHWVVYSGST